MVMNAPVKPAKVSVYVKLWSVGLPGANEAVQLGFGQDPAGGDVGGLVESGGTVSLPFFGLRFPVVAGCEENFVWASTELFGLVPLLLHNTVAV
jgi:hypothetical protein